MLEEQAREADDRVHDIELQWRHAAEVTERREHELREAQARAEADQRHRMYHEQHHDHEYYPHHIEGRPRRYSDEYFYADSMTGD